MKTTLDLTAEFAGLNDAMTRCRGKLLPADARRWAELKPFYDVLMAQEGCPSAASAPGFTVTDIRERVRPRGRLRVRVDSEFVAVYLREHHIVELVNLSWGGALMATQASLEVGTPLTLCFTSFAGIQESLLTVEAEVVWKAEAEPATKAGVRFVDLPARSLKLLDAVILENLENCLLTLRADALDSGFAIREQLVNQVGRNRLARWV